MGREENFKGKTKETQFKAGQEQVEIAKKGAEAANESRKVKKLLKDIAQTMLDAPIQDDFFIAKAMSLYPGLKKEQITQSFAMLSDVIEILRKRKNVPAKDENGKEIKDENGRRVMESKPAYKAADRMEAFKILRDTAGQKPIDKQEITNIDQDGYRRVLMGDEDIFAGDYGSADEGDEEEEDKKE